MTTRVAVEPNREGRRVDASDRAAERERRLQRGPDGRGDLALLLVPELSLPRDDRVAKYRARPDLDVSLPVRPKDEAMNGYSLLANGLPQRPLTASTDPGYIASKARRTWNMAYPWDVQPTCSSMTYRNGSRSGLLRLKGAGLKTLP